MELVFPQHWEICKVNAIACNALDTRWISWIPMVIHFHKVSIRIAINIAQPLRRVDNQTLSTCTLQISTYPFQSQLMRISETEHMMCTTIHHIRYVLTCVSGKIHHYANHATVSELPTRTYEIFILYHCLGLGRSLFEFGRSVNESQL